MRFAERMDRFGEGVFSRLAEMKRKKLEAGEDVVDLSIGAPNIPPAQHILDALCTAAADKSNYCLLYTSNMMWRNSSFMPCSENWIFRGSSLTSRWRLTARGRRKKY